MGFLCVAWRVVGCARRLSGTHAASAAYPRPQPFSRASASAARSAASRVAWRVRVTTSTRAWPEAMRNIARDCQYLAPSASTRSSVYTVSGQPCSTIVLTLMPRLYRQAGPGGSALRRRKAACLRKAARR